MAVDPNDRRIRVIVNADDFGISPGANRAILRAHREGILTSASLMVGAPAATAAIEAARSTPTLGVGLHLTLACGRCTSPPKTISGLVDPAGQFDDQPARAGLRYYLRRRWHPLIKQEMDAQFRAFAATGLPMDHLNGHLHFHLHPTVFGLIRRHWRNWNVRAVRLTRDSLGTSLRLARGRYFYRLSHTLIFDWLSARARATLKLRRIRHAELTFGLLENDQMTEPYLVALFERLTPGVFEVFFHPDEDRHQAELEALISPRVREVVERRGIELIRYQDL